MHTYMHRIRGGAPRTFHLIYNCINQRHTICIWMCTYRNIYTFPGMHTKYDHYHTQKHVVVTQPVIKRYSVFTSIQLFTYFYLLGVCCVHGFNSLHRKGTLIAKSMICTVHNRNAGIRYVHTLYVIRMI